MADTKSTHVAELGQAVRLDAWRHVFEKTNRIISERPVTVQIAESVPHGMDAVPAWTNGEAITFNGPQVMSTLKGKDAVSAVLALKGLNYHELSHVLYTPRMGDELPRMVLKKVKDSGDRDYWYAFNALEDQRIETWFTSVFSASRRYFEATVMNWIVTQGSAEAAALTYGRKYLSSRIRVGAGNVFVQKHGQALYDEIKDVIDQYLTVTFPGQSSKAYTLVVQYRDLLKKVQQLAPLPSLPVPDNGCHHGGAPGRDDPTAVRSGRIIQKVQKAAKEAAEGAMDKAAAADAEAQKQDPAPKQDMPMPDQPADEADGQAQDGADSPGDGADGGDQGQGQDAADKPAETGEGSTQGTSSTTQAQTEGQADPGDGAGMESGEVEVVPTTMRDLMDAATDAMDEIEADPTILRDVEQTLDAVKATEQNGQTDTSGPVANSDNLSEPSEGAKIASRRIQHILMKIRADLEPMRVRNQQHGRLNVRKYLGRRPGEVEIFDQWHEGSEDEASVEAVVLIDMSSSMSARTMEDACGAAWALKRAFDKLEIRSTAILYNSEHKVLYGPNDRARGGAVVVRSSGGTYPMSAYEQSMRIFAKSTAKNKILCNLTDGQWGGVEADYAKVLRTLHAQGVSTMILGLDGAVKHYGKHSHKIGHDIQQVSELPKAVTKWVADILRNTAQV